MILSRRRILQIGGGVLAAPWILQGRRADAAEAVDIAMQGSSDGSRVWFDPVGIHVVPGRTVRWTNRDPGNSHTSTAYHPANFGRPLRIPRGARPWNSDYLLPDESFSVTLTVEGVYDFYCIPHEHAGMVGRIVVGRPTTPSRNVDASPDGGVEPVPEIALRAFPETDEIMRRGIVRHG